MLRRFTGLSPWWEVDRAFCAYCGFCVFCAFCAFWQYAHLVHFVKATFFGTHIDGGNLINVGEPGLALLKGQCARQRSGMKRLLSYSGVAHDVQRTDWIYLTTTQEESSM